MTSFSGEVCKGLGDAPNPGVRSVTAVPLGQSEPFMFGNRRFRLYISRTVMNGRNLFGQDII